MRGLAFLSGIASYFLFISLSPIFQFCDLIFAVATIFVDSFRSGLSISTPYPTLLVYSG